MALPQRAPEVLCRDGCPAGALPAFASACSGLKTNFAFAKKSVDAIRRPICNRVGDVQPPERRYLNAS
jgi:hypothetical protein